MSEPTKQEVIEWFRKGRDVHVAWKDWIRSAGPDAKALEPVVDVAGNEEWHEQWIRMYDAALRLLEVE